MDAQIVRLEAIKAAAKVTDRRGGTGNLLVEAGWIADWVQTGKDPAVDSLEGR